jgi:hypothetical protein
LAAISKAVYRLCLAMCCLFNVELRLGDRAHAPATVSKGYKQLLNRTIHKVMIH